MRPRFLSRCSRISRGGRRSWLAYFCPAARGSCVSSLREERLARAVLHVRRLEVDDGFVEREESEVWFGEGGALGQPDDHPPARRREGRALPAEAPDCDRRLTEHCQCCREVKQI